MRSAPADHHHDWPPVSRCRNGHIEPSDSLYRVGHASLTLAHLLPHRSASAWGGHNRVPRRQPRPSGRYRVSLGKPCGLPANPHRTTAESYRKSGFPIGSKVTPPGQPLVSLSLRSAFRTPTSFRFSVMPETPLSSPCGSLRLKGPQRILTASPHGMRGTLMRASCLPVLRIGRLEACGTGARRRRRLGRLCAVVLLRRPPFSSEPANSVEEPS